MPGQDVGVLGLLEEEELRHDRHRLQVDRERPQDLESGGGGSDCERLGSRGHQWETTGEERGRERRSIKEVGVGACSARTRVPNGRRCTHCEASEQ